MNRPLLILKTGSTFPSLAEREGDFEDWILSGMKLPRESARLADTQSDARLPESSEISGIVITGSHAMVTDADPWLAPASRWLARQVADETPILGICFGHQLLAHALGGEIGWQPGGRQIGSVSIEKLEEAEHDPLFRQFPATFPAPCCHAQSVRSLPPGAIALARSQVDPHQAFRFGDHAWGVQFHPEFSETVLSAYIEHHRDEIRARGDEPDRLINAIQSTPTSEILRLFLERTASS